MLIYYVPSDHIVIQQFLKEEPATFVLALQFIDFANVFHCKIVSFSSIIGSIRRFVIRNVFVLLEIWVFNLGGNIFRHLPVKWQRLIKGRLCLEKVLQVVLKVFKPYFASFWFKDLTKNNNENEYYYHTYFIMFFFNDVFSLIGFHRTSVQHNNCITGQLGLFSRFVLFIHW